MTDAIKKLPPYEPLLVDVRTRSSRIRRLRRSLSDELAARAVVVRDADHAGASRAELAAALGVSPGRVSQMLGGES